MQEEKEVNHIITIMARKQLKKLFFILAIILYCAGCSTQVKYTVPPKHKSVPSEAFWNPLAKKWVVRDKNNTLVLYYTSGDVFGKGRMYIDEDNTLTNLRQGTWKIWYKNGTLKRVEQYVKGDWHGEFIVFHKNGKINLVGKYKNNSKEGTWKYFDEKEKLQRIENYKGNTLVTFKDFVNPVPPPIRPVVIPQEAYFDFIKKIWIGKDDKNNFYGWYLNGQIAWFGKYKDKKLQGNLVYRWKNGNKMSEGNFYEDKKDGVWKYWTRKGKFKEKRKYKKGLMTYRELSNGMQVPVNLPLNVVWIKDIKKWLYKNPKTNTAIFYYQDGIKYQEGTYIKNDKAHGKWITYYKNGKIKNVGTFKNNKRQGIWRTYYSDGRPSSIMYFKNGKLIKKTKIQ